MSTMRNLAHFLEDDTAPQVLPMEISVRDTHINMKVRIPVSSSFLIQSLKIYFFFYPEGIVAELLFTCRIFVLVFPVLFQ